MYCSKCGTQLPEGSRFCTQCGWETGTAVTSGGGSSALNDIAGYIPKLGYAAAWRFVTLIAGILLITLVPSYFEIYHDNIDYIRSLAGNSGVDDFFTAVPYLLVTEIVLFFMGLVSSKLGFFQELSIGSIWFGAFLMKMIYAQNIINVADHPEDAALYSRLNELLIYSDAYDKTSRMCLIATILVIVSWVIKHFEEKCTEKAAAPKQNVLSLLSQSANAQAPSQTPDQRFAKRAGSLADRLSAINSDGGEAASGTWKCSQCGFVNEKTQDSCKSCGKYR